MGINIGFNPEVHDEIPRSLERQRLGISIDSDAIANSRPLNVLYVVYAGVTTHRFRDYWHKGKRAFEYKLAKGNMK